MKMKKRIIHWASLGSLGAFVCLGIGASSLAAETKTFLSPVYSIDKIYRSMEGPSSTQQVYLVDSPTPELLWITGFRTEMMQADGVTPSKPDYMCHVNVDLDPAKHHSTRLLTLSQGELSTQFPKGYGMPILSNDALSLTTQVLNLNDPHLKIQVRHKVTFEFVRDHDLKKPMKPLMNVVPFVMAPLEEPEPAKSGMAAVPTMHGDSCLPGMDMSTVHNAPNANGGSIYKGENGRSMSGHWVVPPGHSEVRFNVTQLMHLPFDTTLHFAAVHLHPYATSLELRDITANKTVFISHTRNPKGRIGLDAVENYSSAKGTPLYKDHQYELTSVYDNPSGKDSDSMAVMLLFLLDKEFKKPVLPTDAPAVATTAPRILMQTSLGDLTLALDPQAAPQTVRQFLALVQANVYEGVPASFVRPGFLIQWAQAAERATPLSLAQSALLKNLPLETGSLKHRRGVLSMAHYPNDPNSGQSSFCILFGDAPPLDGNYTAFGTVEAGESVLAALEATPNTSGRPDSRIEIKHMALLKRH